MSLIIESNRVGITIPIEFQNDTTIKDIKNIVHDQTGIDVGDMYFLWYSKNIVTVPDIVLDKADFSAFGLKDTSLAKNYENGTIALVVKYSHYPRFFLGG